MEHYRQTLDNMLEGCQIIGFDWRCLYVNDAVAKHGRQTKGKLLGRTMMDVYPGIEKTEVFAALRRCMVERTPSHMENEFAYPGGTTGWFELSIQPVPEGIFILSIDITERKRVEEALRESEERYRTVFETIGTAAVIIEEDTTLSLANAEFESLSGYSKEELEGKKSWTEFVVADDLERMKGYHRLRRVGPDTAPKRYEFRFVDRRGDVKDIFLSVDTIPGTRKSVASLLDITESKQAEERIQRQLRRLTALREIDKAITASLDLRGTLGVILDQVTTQLGVDAADVLLFNPHAQVLEYAAGRGFRSRALQHTNLRLGDGYAGRAALERRIVSIPDLEEAENGLRRAPLLPQEEFASYYAVPLIAKGQVKGVLEILHRAPLGPAPEWLVFLETLAGQTAIAIDNAELFDNLQRSNVELTLAYDTTLEGWAHALELRDHETEGHTRRVTELTVRLARTIAMRDDELIHVRRGALLHDIGKMGIPDSILFKPGKLNDEEWEIMHQHPVYAYQLLLPIAHLRPALDIPYCHHEKWDGTGYPQGLKGEEIPLAARIFAVADVWDALRSDRSYREAWSEERALEYIREQAGKHFDPQLVGVFLKSEMMRAAERGDEVIT